MIPFGIVKARREKLLSACVLVIPFATSNFVQSLCHTEQANAGIYVAMLKRKTLSNPTRCCAFNLSIVNAERVCKVKENERKLNEEETKKKIFAYPFHWR